MRRRSNADTDADRHGYCHTHRDGYGYGYTYADRDRDRHAGKDYADAETAAHAAAASISRFCEESLIVMTAQGRCFTFSTPGGRREAIVKNDADRELFFELAERTCPASPGFIVLGRVGVAVHNNGHAALYSNPTSTTSLHRSLRRGERDVAQRVSPKSIAKSSDSKSKLPRLLQVYRKSARSSN